jgi:branched-chain amino acid aminotransferase
MNMKKIEWDSLTFSLTPTKSMFISTCDDGQNWSEGKLSPFGNISMSPAAGVLNYGQGIFEGMKAFRTMKDRIVLFRPEKNIERATLSAERICIPIVPSGLFMDGLKQVIKDNIEFIPPTDKGSLYIRPIIWGTGPVLGVAPAPSYTFLIYVSPVGPYFKSGIRCLNLRVTRQFHRAAPRGVGNFKTIGNYAASLYPQKLAKSSGFDEVIYLNAGDNDSIEEVGSANLFIIKDEIVSTPPLGGSILPGVTRDSVLRIADGILGLDVEERPISLQEMMTADEVFCTGTAVSVTPIGEITSDDSVGIINENKIGVMTQKLNNELNGIQKEIKNDPFNWLFEI